MSEYSSCPTFRFGDSAELSERLIRLVRSGEKRATCCALRQYHLDGEALPLAGNRSVALNWDGSPALLIETTHVSITRFCDVDEAFALAEGEDATFDGWRNGHQTYFERNGGFIPEMELVCERFRLVTDLESCK